MSYFDTYHEALSAAIKQSKGQLGDCKLYIKLANLPGDGGDTNWYKIGFTPDDADDSYIYNGRIYSSVKDGEGTIFKCAEDK